VRALVVAAVLLCPAAAVAHPLDMATLRVADGLDGAVDVRFDLALGAPGGAVDVVPTGACVERDGTREADGAVVRVRARWDCGEAGAADAEGRLVGAAERGLETVFVVGTGPRATTRLLRDGREAWAAGTADAVFVPHARLGMEHILAGVDHLLFVALLLVLVGADPRASAATVTAFTIGHSLTLAVGALGGPAPARAPVEALIAASVVFAAAEVLRPPEGRGLIGRRPAIAAGLFGLLHGFGFAGALAASGLPRGAEGRALLGFNLGVEAGQLLFAASALVALRILRRDPARPLAYVAGAGAAFLFLQGLADLG